MPPAASTPSYPALIHFAVPVMLASIATPLMGMVDTAVLGRLGEPAIIAAAGVGAMLFTMIYWCFSFLRYTTTAQVAQAIGRTDERAVLLAGLRPMVAALLGGSALWLLQWPLGSMALGLLSPPPDVLPFAHTYFHARIWSAPFTLLSYAQFAWLIAHGRTRTVMLLQLAMNGLNAALAMLYVLVFHWGIAGAAWATVTSEVCISIVMSAIVLHAVPFARWRSVLDDAWDATEWRVLFSANMDILIRTLLLTGSFALMTERGGRLGTLALAANQILMQAFLLVANLLDGFAVAAEVFGARAIGAGSRGALVEVVKRTAILSLGWGVLLACVLAVLKTPYLDERAAAGRGLDLLAVACAVAGHLHLGISLGRRVHRRGADPHAAQHHAGQRLDLRARVISLVVGLGQPWYLGRSRRIDGGAQHSAVACVARAAKVGGGGG